jgi:TRAP-type C4-dicarboxylate transport system permease small subunit
MQPNKLGTIDQVMTAVMKWTSAFCLAALVLLVGAGVFVRFVPVSSMGWADEIIELVFAWLVFFGAAWLWRSRTHFKVDLLEHLLAGTRCTLVLELTIQFICLLFLLVLAYEGWLLTLAAVDTSPILELPKSLWYAVIPISAVIMTAYSLRDIWLLFTRGRLKDAQPAPAECAPETDI